LLAHRSVHLLKLGELVRAQLIVTGLVATESFPLGTNCAHSSAERPGFTLTFSSAEEKSVSGYESSGMYTEAISIATGFKKLACNGMTDCDSDFLIPACKPYFLEFLYDTP